MRRLLILLPLLWSSGAKACINDRDSDSLAIQAARFPDTLRVITGRFERNPPLYYQMRIRRSLAQLKQTPRDFNLYDDIGVAFDRLHRDDEALQIMAKKRALLPPFDAKNPKLKEAWYRYFANTGTFHAHRFLGKKSGQISEMKLARDQIKRAIEIKPDAHFGREKYQLLAMDWILAIKTGKTDKTLGIWISKRDQWEEIWEAARQSAPRRAKAVEGLSGLIVLGAAWQSADVFEALSCALESKSGVTLRHLALRRDEEIVKSGGVSLAPKHLNSKIINDLLEYTEVNDYGIGVNNRNKKTLDEFFLKLRAEADTWSKKRTIYMLMRLEKGVHPDTDAKFWNNWKPAAPPNLELSWHDEGKTSNNIFIGFGIAILVLFLAGIIGIFWLFRRSRRKRNFA